MKKNLAILSLVLLLPFFSCFSDDKKEDNSTSHSPEENAIVLSVNDEVTAAVDGAVNDALASSVKKMHKLAMSSIVKSVKEQVFNKSIKSKAPVTGSDTFNDTVDGDVSGTAVITGSSSWSEDYTEGIPENPADAAIGVEYTETGSYTENLNISLTFDNLINNSESGSGTVELDGGPLAYNSSYVENEEETVKVISYTNGDNFSYDENVSGTETINVTINGTITFYNSDYPAGITVTYTDFKTTLKFEYSISGLVVVAGESETELPITVNETLKVSGSIAIGDNVVEYENEVVVDETYEVTDEKK